MQCSEILQSVSYETARIYLWSMIESHINMIVLSVVKLRVMMIINIQWLYFTNKIIQSDYVLYGDFWEILYTIQYL